MSVLTPDVASRFAQAALGHVGREYPNVLQHTFIGPEDARTPAALHPIFYGSFDWHSCVHSHWMLARLLRAYPDLPEAGAISAWFDQGFTRSKVEREAHYFEPLHRRGYERPYGWAWLLKLAAELTLHSRPWGRTLQPLTQVIAQRLAASLPKADYPVRAGVHSNTAFALALANDYALATVDGALQRQIVDKAQAWYGADADCQAWEPSGDDFLSGALVEAELMRRVLPAAEFRAWFARFLPRAGQGAPASLFAPAAVSDRSDGKIAHLDGLNLSRAWCWRGVARALADDGPVRLVALEAGERHLAASLEHVTGDYMGEHWLASFALLAMLEDA